MHKKETAGGSRRYPKITWTESLGYLILAHFPWIFGLLNSLLQGGETC